MTYLTAKINIIFSVIFTQNVQKSQLLKNNFMRILIYCIVIFIFVYILIYVNMEWSAGGNQPEKRKNVGFGYGM